MQGYLRRKDHLVPALGKGETLSPQTVGSRGKLAAWTWSATGSPPGGHHRAVLRSALAMAQRWSILTRNVAGLAEAPRVERRELTVLDADQVRQLFESTADDRLHALWVLAATTGMRQAELLGLTWRYAKGGVVRVERTLARIDGSWAMVEPKTKTSRRTIPLTPVAIAALTRHHARQQREWLEDVKNLLGHSTIALTSNTYGHYVERRGREVAAGMERAVGAGS